MQSSDPVAVDLWPFSIEPATSTGVPNSEELLSADERTRAGRFRFPRDRTRYVTGRAKLRSILSSYADSPPGDLRFDYGDQGKPDLPEHPSVCFNLANCEGHALVAVTSGHRVGVDLERVRPEFAEDHIAEHFFSATEVEYLRMLPMSQQEQAFFECWTRKEAFLKAKGGGLSVRLDAFVVSFGPGQPAQLVRSELDPADPTRWQMVDVSTALPGHVAAVVVEAGRRPLCVTTYREDMGGRAPRGQR